MPEELVPHYPYKIIVDEREVSTRIDTYLSTHFSRYSRSFFSRLIDYGGVTLNNKLVEKQSHLVKEGDHITICVPEQKSCDSATIKKGVVGVKILYTDKHFYIIHKPAGLIVHPPKVNFTAPTLVDWLLLTLNDIASVGYSDRPGIVHRLDKDTSGILIIARTPYAHDQFGSFFRNRTIEKTYLAVVSGHPVEIGTINSYIGRHPVHRKKMISYSTETENNHRSGKLRASLTHYRVKSYLKDCALVEVKPVTGRTHQIRVQFASIGHPLIGDHLYGTTSSLIERHALHAHAISFSFDNKKYSFVDHPPNDLKILIKKMKVT